MVSTNINFDGGKYKVMQRDHETLTTWRMVSSSYDLDVAKKSAIKRADKGQAYFGQVRL